MPLTESEICVTLVRFASVCSFLDETQASSYKTIGVQCQHHCCHGFATTCCFVTQLCSVTYVLIFRTPSAPLPHPFRTPSALVGLSGQLGFAEQTK